MKKTLYLSTREGSFMLFFAGRVDSFFRVLLRAAKDEKVDIENFRKLYLSWKAYLEEHLVFLDTLAGSYETPYIQKTQPKRYKYILEELRETGQKKSVIFKSALASQLFQAIIHTEMTYAVLHSHYQSGDVLFVQYWNLTEKFKARQTEMEGKIRSLRKTQNTLKDVIYAHQK